MSKNVNITRTTFKAQAALVQRFAQNPTLTAEELGSLHETAGALLWLNQLQLHWASGHRDVPADIYKHLFDGRPAQRLVVEKPPQQETKDLVFSSTP